MKNICPHCETIFQSDSKFQSHRSECNGEWPPGKGEEGQDRKKERSQHKCKHCGKKFENQAKLDTHVVMCPEDDTEYECDDCGKVLPTKRHYENHTKSCDKDEKTENQENRESSGTPASIGKEIKNDGRGERKSGKNPFADPERLKDTGLHMGGG